MKKVKKIVLPIFIILVTGAITVLVLYSKDLDIRDEAADSDFDPKIYRGMARFGLGRLAECFVREQDLEGYNDYKFGWFHNWTNNKEFIDNDSGVFPTEIPDSLDYYGLLGGYHPKSTDCPESLKNILEGYKDSDVIWIGNEIGWDDKRDPTTYATQYKSWYECVKAVNPNIKVAPGANPGYPEYKYGDDQINEWEISNDSKGRWSSGSELDYFNYITYAKNDYKEIYGDDMPIEAYVIHVYPCANNGDCHNIDFVEAQIRKFREFMKDNREKKLPLYIKEMSTVMGDELTEEDKNSVVELYNKLLNLKDSSIGNPNDNNRLVQRWAWFFGPAPCKAPDHTSCTWKNTSLFLCEMVDDKWWSGNCTEYREETLLAGKHRDYVEDIWDSYDSQPPDKPEITYELNGNTANISFSASDNEGINNYEISVGAQEGGTDLMLWTSTDTESSFVVNNAMGKYVNVKAIDDGYNWSEVSSVKVKEEQSDFIGSESKADIVPSGGDEKVDMLDLAMVLNNWKWKKEDKDIKADINGDEEVNIVDIALIVNSWTKKY